MYTFSFIRREKMGASCGKDTKDASGKGLNEDQTVRNTGIRNKENVMNE